MIENGDESEKMVEGEFNTPSREDLLGMLDNMINSYDNLPQVAMITSVNHYDLLSFMMLVKALFTHI